MSSELPAWGAVCALSAGVASLITAEFLPVSLLPPMAAELRVSEGLAGQAMTATAASAVLASLLIASATRRWDRRRVLLAFSVLLVLANLLAALAPNLATLLLGRMLLGLGLGGFWAMSTATVMRLVPEASVPRALSIMFGTGSVASLLAVPLGSYLSGTLGWRLVFLLAAGLGLAALIWQWLALPAMAARPGTSLRILLQVVKRPGVASGMTSVILAFMGNFACFTYLRPVLETVPGIGTNGISLILLGYGLSNIVGTALAEPALRWNLRLTLACLPLLMAALAAGLLACNSSPLAVAALVILWGLGAGAIPVGWSNWLSRTVPDEAESAGGLMIAAIQLAITIGAALGGLVFDRWSAPGTFTLSGLMLLSAALVTLLSLNGPIASSRRPRF